jgi:hypothetical protein
MSGLEWTTPRIEDVPMDDHYRALYRQALEDEPVAPWEKDAFDVAEAVLAVVEEGDGCAVCIELEALIQTRRAVAAPAAPDHRLEEARAVRIEDEQPAAGSSYVAGMSAPDHARRAAGRTGSRSTSRNSFGIAVYASAAATSSRSCAISMA